MRCRCGKKDLEPGERVYFNAYQHAALDYVGVAAYCGPLAHVERDELRSEVARLTQWQYEVMESLTDGTCLDTDVVPMIQRLREESDSLHDECAGLTGETAKLRAVNWAYLRAIDEEDDEAEALETRVERLQAVVEAYPTSQQLRTLVAWFDMKESSNRWSGRVVQESLERLAAALDALEEK